MLLLNKYLLSEWMNDNERNTFGHSSTPVKISADDSKVAVYMIPTNEELVIAQDTEAIVKAL